MLKGVLIGAVSGAVFSGVSGYVGEAIAHAGVAGGVGPPTAGGTLAGQVGGGIAGGATAGATSSGMYGSDVGLGALYGGIMGGLGSFGAPNFAPFGDSAAGTTGNRLFNSSLTGGTLGTAYAGITGENVWQGSARGAIAWGLGEAANMGIGHGLGYMMSGAGPKYSNGAFYYYSKEQVPFTIGGAIIGDEDYILGYNIVNGQLDYNHTVDQHERAHFAQQTALSVSYIPVHVISQGIGGLTGLFTGAGFLNGTHRYNVFERW
ncbi:MAG: hypothetical protein QY310_03115 [Candidatus Jettenia sp. CY-1]|nr:MAG: hypothetical protein QY310_03115 [Candidatus Jettenia sp. CY-1]